MHKDRIKYLEQLSKEEIKIQIALGSFDIDDLWVLKEKYKELRYWCIPFIYAIEYAYCRKFVGI